MTKIITRAFHLVNIFIVVGSALFVYLYWIEGSPPVQYSNLPFPVEQRVYNGGEAIGFQITACRKKNIPFTVTAAIVDGFTIDFDSFELSGMDIGCHTTITRSFIVPMFLPSGEYKLAGVNVFHVNFLRDRVVRWETQAFQVENRE